jgi:hypothetical protein
MFFCLMASLPYRAAVFALGALSAISPAASPARQPDTEEGLQARIERENNPVKKAKYEVRLGRLKLLNAVEAYDKGNLELFQRLLGEYVEHMKNAWQTLEASGRRAVRQPQGFKELDIALREDARTLEDLKHRVPYDEREPVEKASQEVEELRGEVLRALFPVTGTARGESKFYASGREFLVGRFPR